jgi:FixJ family two-component response regulator
MRPAIAAPIVAVVEDDEPVQHSISGLLQSAGYRYAAYGSAEAFLDVYPLLQPQPLCAVVDFRLPGMTGVDLQRTLIDMRRPLPIIVVSAFEDRVRAEAFEHGAIAVLGKPFDSEILLAVIESTLDPQVRNRALGLR